MTGRLLFSAAILLLAQTTVPVDQRRRLAEDLRHPTGEELLAVRSERIALALRSPEALWALVTSPENFYLERRAAAFQAKGLIPVAWVSKVWQAVEELIRQQGVDQFGLKPHPLASRAWYPESPAPLVPRRILGHQWTPPPQPLDYPLTAKEREQAPWPWQVLAALMDLRAGLIPSTYGPLERDRADAYLAAVLTMPCNTDEDASRLVAAASVSSHYKTPAIMATLRNIAMNPRFPQAAIRVGTTYADATRLWDDPRSWAIGAAGMAEILRSSPHSGGRENTAYFAKDLREVFAGGRTLRRPLPAEVILEMSRLALDPRSGSDWTRLYVYVFSVMEALDDPPFPAERGMDMASPAVGRRLSDFAAWFEQHRRGLEELAAAQKPVIDETVAMLAPTATCRATPAAGEFLN